MSLLEKLDLALGGDKLPVILQTEAAECGLACLAMVANAHGFRCNLINLRKRFALSLKGATLIDLIQIAGQMNLASRPLQLDMKHLSALKTPCILHWNVNHFVVLKNVKGQQVVIHDPALGVRTLHVADVSHHFTGIALELTPTAAFTTGDERQSITLRQLLGRITGLKRSLMQIMVLALGLEVFALVSPFFMQWVVDSVLLTADRDLLATLGIGFLMLVVIQSITGAIRSWAVLYLSSTLNLQWLGNVFSHLMHLPTVWFERRHMGDILSRFGAISQIQQALTGNFIEAILDGLLVIVTLSMMFYYSPSLTTVAIGAVALYAAARAVLYLPLRRATEEHIIHASKQQSHFLESIRGVQSIKLFDRQEARRARFLNLVVDTMNSDIGIKKLGISFLTISRLLFGGERILVVWLGALHVLEHRFSVGMLFAFLSYKEQFATRFSALIDKFLDLRMLKLQGERLADIVMSAPEVDEASGSLSPDEIEASIDVRNVKFRYSDTEPYVLDGCSFKVEPGESLAIVGPSGCGKTTLLKLLLGVHTPQEGDIRINGMRLPRLGLSNYRKMVGTVMQDDQLFAGSIQENVSFFADEIDPARVAASAQMAAVHDEIVAMPMGYHTLIGDMGAALSGGQKQRILLARALYKRPKILFLDEATSALDVERERAVNEAIKGLNLTRIIIAHRPETIASADRVIVLLDGKVVEDLRSVPDTSGRPEEFATGTY